MMISNTKKVQSLSIVTGGARGIGRAIAEMLNSRGDLVIIFDCLAEATESIIELKQLNIHYIQTDLSQVSEIKKAFKKVDLIIAEYKLPGITLFVANAGVNKDSIALRAREEDWDLIFNVNLKGSFFCAQQALLRMHLQPSYLIFMSSVVGITGNAGQSMYAASKAGLLGITKSLAKEYAQRKILVNALAPGFIETPMTSMLSEEIQEKITEQIPLSRLGSTRDIAAYVDFLSSGKADYITGQVINVNGGMI